MSIPAISLRKLTKRYHQTVAVDSVTLDIAPGTIYGFLGPNGSGKTTTIRMLLGLVTPTAGTAHIFGHDIQRDRAWIAQHVGAIVEVPAFYGYLTGAQNLTLLAHTSNIALSPQRLTELVELVGLRGREYERVQGYSLGMKQRLGIAATLVARPKVLFLDEPTNGLDPLGTIELRQLLIRLGAEGYTIFLSSHVLREVEQVCTDVTIVHRGVVQMHGRVRDVLAASDQYALEVTPNTQAQAILDTQCAVQSRLREDGWLIVTCTRDQIPALIQALAAADMQVYQVIRHQMTLEDVFLASIQASMGDAHGSLLQENG